MVENTQEVEGQNKTVQKQNEAVQKSNIRTISARSGVKKHMATKCPTKVERMQLVIQAKALSLQRDRWDAVSFAPLPGRDGHAEEPLPLALVLDPPASDASVARANN
jgi:predicted oxidoreductase